MGGGDQLFRARLAARLLEPRGERDLLVLDRVARFEIELALAAPEIACPGRPCFALNRHRQPPLRLLRLACSTSGPAALSEGSPRQTRPGRCEGRCSPVPGRAFSRRSSS